MGPAARGFLMARKESRFQVRGFSHFSSSSGCPPRGFGSPHAHKVFVRWASQTLRRILAIRENHTRKPKEECSEGKADRC